MIWLRRRFNIPLLNVLRPRPSGLDEDMKSRFFHVYGKRSERPSIHPEASSSQEEFLSQEEYPKEQDWRPPTIDAIGKSKYYIIYIAFCVEWLVVMQYVCYQNSEYDYLRTKRTLPSQLCRRINLIQFNVKDRYFTNNNTKL